MVYFLIKIDGRTPNWKWFLISRAGRSANLYVSAEEGKIFGFI